MAVQLFPTFPHMASAQSISWDECTRLIYVCSCNACFCRCMDVCGFKVQMLQTTAQNVHGPVDGSQLTSMLRWYLRTCHNLSTVQHGAKSVANAFINQAQRPPEMQKWTAWWHYVPFYAFLYCMALHQEAHLSLPARSTKRTLDSRTRSPSCCWTVSVRMPWTTKASSGRLQPIFIVGTRKALYNQ